MRRAPPDDVRDVGENGAAGRSDPARQPPAPLGAIRSVAAVCAPVTADVTVLSVEFFEHGLVVRWLLARPDVEHAPRLEVRDDTGCRYVRGGGGSFTGDRATRGEDVYRPAVRPMATRLSISSSEGMTVEAEVP